MLSVLVTEHKNISQLDRLATPVKLIFLQLVV